MKLSMLWIVRYKRVYIHIRWLLYSLLPESDFSETSSERLPSVFIFVSYKTFSISLLRFMSKFRAEILDHFDVVCNF